VNPRLWQRASPVLRVATSAVADLSGATLRVEAASELLLRAARFRLDGVNIDALGVMGAAFPAAPTCAFEARVQRDPPA